MVDGGGEHRIYLFRHLDQKLFLKAVSQTGLKSEGSEFYGNRFSIELCELSFSG